MSRTHASTEHYDLLLAHLLSDDAFMIVWNENLVEHPDTEGHFQATTLVVTWNADSMVLELPAEVYSRTFARGDILRVQLSASSRRQQRQRNWLAKLLDLRAHLYESPVVLLRLDTRGAERLLLAAEASLEQLAGLPQLEVGPDTRWVPMEGLECLIRVALSLGAHMARIDVLSRVPSAKGTGAHYLLRFGTLLERIKSGGERSQGNVELGKEAGDLQLSWNEDQVAFVGVTPGVYPPPPFVRFLATREQPGSLELSRARATSFDAPTLVAVFRTAEHTLRLTTSLPNDNLFDELPVASQGMGIELGFEDFEAILLSVCALGAEHRWKPSEG